MENEIDEINKRAKMCLNVDSMLLRFLKKLEKIKLIRRENIGGIINLEANSVPKKLSSHNFSN